MGEITEEENLKNMQRCPRWEDCSIPKCPLDFWMAERVELPDEPICPLRRITEKKRGKRIRGIITPKMRDIFNFVRDFWAKSSKIRENKGNFKISQQ